MSDLAIYIHWPFCQSKCPYCDFNSHVAQSIDHENWRNAYRIEIEHYAKLLPERTIRSIFFGGGTPSLMEAKTVGEILEYIKRYWQWDNNIEITLEANPSSVEAQKFADFKAAGVNRLSLGVQSLDDEALKFLGRKHDAGEARRAIALASRYFPRFSFDLIYARKNQTGEAWRRELKEALSLAGEHLSLYQLTIEPGTQFHTLAQRERLTSADEETATLYELTQDILNKAGLPAYEISNHARPGAESRHNLAYWHYEDYIGIGPGAHGRYRLGGRRYATEDHRAPELWLARIKDQGHGLRLCDPIELEIAQREALMMGLRLASGIELADWHKKFGADLIAESGLISPEKIKRLNDEGYIVNGAETLKATSAGLQRLNAVLAFLLN
jgi:oxygen-independent coproporphyrinogen-3 oxidase